MRRKPFTVHQTEGRGGDTEAGCEQVSASADSRRFAVGRRAGLALGHGRNRNATRPTLPQQLSGFSASPQRRSSRSRALRSRYSCFYVEWPRIWEQVEELLTAMSEAGYHYSRVL